MATTFSAALERHPLRIFQIATFAICMLVLTCDGIDQQLLGIIAPRVIEAFGSWVEKSLYGRKYMGIDRSTFLFDATGKLIRIWRKVKVPGHVDEVLEAVRGLAA